MERTEPLAYGSLIKKLDHNKSKWKIPVQICDESIQQYFQGAASEDYASHLQTYLLQKLGEGRYESEDAAVFDGHSDIGVTMNTYTHLGLDDAKNEMIRMEELEQARKEVDKAEGKKPMKQNMFKVV